MANNKVGFKRPPKEHQFKPGKSGNPSGRPPKLPTMQEVVAAELAKRVRIAEDGLEFSVSKQDALIKKLVDEAVNGNQRAITAVIALCQASQSADQHAPDEMDESLLEEFVEQEVERRLKARGSTGEIPE